MRSAPNFSKDEAGGGEILVGPMDGFVLTFGAGAFNCFLF